LLISGLPDYDKLTAIVLGILLGTLLFQPNRLLSLRPRWFDLPIICWCLCPLVSSLENGLGWYDGSSALLATFVHWGLTYLIGRMYFNTLEGLRELTIGVFIGGLAYVLPTAFEIRMSPMLRGIVYGVASGAGMRFGGYRPVVFLTTGLEHGMWMTAAVLTGTWLWKWGRLRRIGLVPVGSVLIPVLSIITILCRSTGALVLLLCGLLVLWLSTRFNSKLFVAALLLIAPMYYALRIPNISSGEELVNAIETYLSPERAESLGFRFKSENKLTVRALQQPVWGWGGWGRSRITGEDGRDQAPTDGMWIIYLGTYGLVGLTTWTVVMLLPSWLFLSRYSVSEWKTPLVGPLASVAVLLGLYQIDCLVNGFINPIFLVAAGGLICVQPVSLPSKASVWDRAATEPIAGLDQPHTSDDLQHQLCIPAQDDLPNATPEDQQTHPTVFQEHLAERYEKLARTLKSQGSLSDAKDAWVHALIILSNLVSAYPDLIKLRRRRADCANNLAWFLVNELAPAVRDLEMAIQYATQATEVDPQCATYWNTLGAAYHTAGEDAKAITALQHSVALAGGGTAFDFIFLALAYHQLGYHEEARRWSSQASLWIEQHGFEHPDLPHLYQHACVSLASPPALSRSDPC
jgi:hypothetical protein